MKKMEKARQIHQIILISKQVKHIPELDDPITEQEVHQAIRNMKHGKASGIDEICGEFLKYSENVVVSFLT